MLYICGNKLPVVTTAVNQKVKLKTSIPGVTLQLTFEILHFCQIYSSCTCTPLVAKDLICFFLSELQLLVTLVWMELKSLSEMFPYQFYCIFLGPGTAEPCELPSMGSPRVGHDLRAAVYGVTQSWTRLKRLSSSSSRPCRRCL